MACGVFPSIFHIVESSWDFGSWRSGILVGNTPQAMIIKGPSDDDTVVFKDLDIEFSKNFNAIIIAQLADG